MPDKYLNTGPIFIVGMNGSGTTVLLDLLDSHSEVFGFADETRILPYYLQRGASDHAGVGSANQRKMWDSMRREFPFWKANGEMAVPLPPDWRELGNSAAEIFDYIMNWFAARAGKSIWCEKTPMHALHINDLGSAFPNARFIHIIRDGRDCAASFRRRCGYNAAVSIYRWKQTVRTARSQVLEMSNDRYKEVRFEALTTEPTPVVHDICDFLGIKFEESMLTANRTTNRVRGLNSRQLRPNSGTFRTSFSAKEIDELESIAGRLLDELGYEVQNKLGDSAVARSKIWASQTVTHFLRLRDILRRARSAKNPLRLLVMRIRNGIMHRKTSNL